MNEQQTIKEAQDLLRQLYQELEASELVEKVATAAVLSELSPAVNLGELTNYEN